MPNALGSAAPTSKARSSTRATSGARRWPTPASATPSSLTPASTSGPRSATGSSTRPNSRRAATPTSIQETTGGASITYAIKDPEAAPERYLFSVFFKSLYFSTVTFATLGDGDIRPVGAVARAVAESEVLLGQLLLALFVFVLTRTVTWPE